MKFDLRKFYNKYFPYIFITLFLALSILLITHHEFWRDEVHAWDIAIDSKSLSEFVYYMRQSEGTPYLWHFILYLISHYITQNIESIKVIHLTISTVTAFLFLKFAPFNKLIRVLFIFGYFIFFEYSIISRNYALGLLLIFIFCILYKNKYKNILPISIVLLFMGACNIYSFFISVSFMVLLLIDFIQERKTGAKKVNKVFLSLAVLIMLSSFVLIYWQVGGQFLYGFSNNILQNISQDVSQREILLDYLTKLKNLPDIIVSSYIHIPVINLNFWNTNILVRLLSDTSILTITLVALLFIIISTILLRTKFKIIFLLNLFVMFSFMALFYMGSLRHWGHIFIIFCASLWLSKVQEKGKKELIAEKQKHDFYSLKSKKLLTNTFLILILSCSLIGSATAFYYDYKYPFSNGKNVSEYLKKNYDVNNMIIAGYRSYTTETIAGYMKKDFYYPEEKKFSKVFSMIYRTQITPDEVLSDAIKLKVQNLDKEVLITNDKGNDFPSELINDYGFKFDKEFIDAIVWDENFQLYFLNPNLSFKLLKKIDSSNFIESWGNLNGCEFQIINSEKIQIKTFNDDPHFESNFKIPVKSGSDRLLLKIIIEVPEDSYLKVYYKRINSQYNENDLGAAKLEKGINTVVFMIKNSDKLEGIRIDPVNIKTDCIIEKIEFYSISKDF